MRTPVSDVFIVKEERNRYKDRYFERQSTKTSTKRHNLPPLSDTVSDGGYEQWRDGDHDYNIDARGERKGEASWVPIGCTDLQDLPARPKPTEGC